MINKDKIVSQLNGCQSMLEVFYKRFSVESIERKCVENIIIALQHVIDDFKN